MPAFPAETPPIGQNVEVTLVNGTTCVALYDGAQWWVGVPDQDADIPLANEFVVSWAIAA